MDPCNLKISRCYRAIYMTVSQMPFFFKKVTRKQDTELVKEGKVSRSLAEKSPRTPFLTSLWYVNEMKTRMTFCCPRCLVSWRAINIPHQASMQKWTWLVYLFFLKVKIISTMDGRHLTLTRIGGWEKCTLNTKKTKDKEIFRNTW